MVNALGIFLVLIVVIIWAMASIIYKLILGNKTDVKADPLTALAMRILFVTLLMLFLSLLFGDILAPLSLSPEERRRYLFASILAGIFTFASDILYFFALQYLDSSRVFPIVNTQILFTFPVAAYLFNEKISPYMWISGVLMIIGVAIISKGDNLDQGMEKIDARNQKKRYVIGITMAILVGMFYAFEYLAMTYAIRISDGVLVANFYRLILYCILYWSYILITRIHIPRRRTPEEKVIFKNYLYCGLIGAISLGIGDSLYQEGVKLNNSSISIVIGSNGPIFNQIFAILILKEKARPRLILGVFLIVLANLLVIL